MANRPLLAASTDSMAFLAEGLKVQLARFKICKKQPQKPIARLERPLYSGNNNRSLSAAICPQRRGFSSERNALLFD